MSDEKSIQYIEKYMGLSMMMCGSYVMFSGPVSFAMLLRYPFLSVPEELKVEAMTALLTKTG